MISAVFDQYKRVIPEPTVQPSNPPWGPIVTPVNAVEVVLSPAQLQQLIDAFHKSVEAARQADQATGAGDCKDPEKAKLEDRVAELERRLDRLTAAMRGV